MKKRIAALVKKDLVWFIAFTSLLYLLAYTPIFYQYTHLPRGRSYLGFNAFAIDWLGQMAIAEEGYSGQVLRTPIMSSTMDGRPFLVKTEYLLIGNAARILGISVLTAMKTAIFVISAFYIISVWLIIKNIFRSKLKRLIALALVFFATGISLPPDLLLWNNLPKYSQVFLRMTLDAPHYMISSVFSLISVYLLSRCFEKMNTKNFILSLITGLIAVQTFFPPMLVTYISLVIYFLIRSLRNRNILIIRRELLLITTYGLVSSLPLIQLWYASSFFDMNTYKQSEQIVPSVIHNIREYLIAVGLIILPVIYISPYLIKLNQPFLLICLSWILAHTVSVFWVSKIFGTNPVRFFQTPYYVYLGILAAVGIDRIYHTIKNNANRILAYSTVFLIISVIIGSSWFSYILSYRFNALENYDLINDLGYPGSNEYQAMNWLSHYCGGRKVILSGENSGTLLLALTPCRVYYSGWVTKALLWNDNQFLDTSMKNFYAEKFNSDEALAFIKDNRIKYVYYGGAEKYFHSLGGKSGELEYPFLEKIYDQDNVIIYRVKSL